MSEVRNEIFTILQCLLVCKELLNTEPKDMRYVGISLKSQLKKLIHEGNLNFIIGDYNQKYEEIGKY